MKTAFLVLGAQRSGTSATSHVLSQFGINFGSSKNFLQDEHNPIFFELKWVNQLNERLIQALGHQYTDFFLPIESDYQTAEVVKIATEFPDLIWDEWRDKTTIGIKDPRFSLTFPVWERVLLGAGYTLKIIFVFRCPDCFLRSNRELFKDWPQWNDMRHLRFWLQSNLAGIYFTRNYPVHFINYDNLMSYPLGTADQLANVFGLDEDDVANAASVVNNSCHHHEQSSEVNDLTIAHYYNLLASHRLSATDYLNYRASLLTEKYSV